ncbi:GPP34 family phosphoprotein [Streptomyces sp. H10-C2]|uniref:GOLPH3/VPS74 family protein n=1 Tax=unclassified Streptomyces TaxID=2593676 RepID=UPI0024B99EAB|nr:MULTISPECIES: GPP34 family phosphoprotein [unclassified Streptomyces]MDJ0343418.1 GPP34 family phosphoprotein [Streptomyces sp. PH10-H1]MDJ0371771.1 GPP34 family phosphoprotein [Streptomyces sp. H10-C2]
MELTVAEELLLLGRGPQGRSAMSGLVATRGVAGALLIELALQERIIVQDGRLAAAKSDAGGSYDPELDTLCRQIRDERRRTAKAWVQKAESRRVNARILSGLAAKGVLREQPYRVLGLFPVVRWTEQDPALAAGVRRRLTAALQGEPTDDRTVALIALVDACGLSRKLFPELDSRTRKARINELSQSQWGAAAVRDAVTAVRAGVTAAIVAASSASSAA